MEEELIKFAIKASQNSYSPYSNFVVGAALLTKDNKVYLGCNIENACGTSNCAERTAFYKAISDGYKEFKAIAIVGGKNGKFNKLCPPCGICRQTMSEFCDEDFVIILGNEKLEYKKYALKQLLPLSFELEG